MGKLVVVVSSLLVLAAGCAQRPSSACIDVYGAVSCHWHADRANRDGWRF
jgi:hypothetical protein